MICSIYLFIEILNPKVEDMIYLLYLLYLPGKFSGYFAGGGLGTGFLPSHTLCMYIS